MDLGFLFVCGLCSWCLGDSVCFMLCDVSGGLNLAYVCGGWLWCGIFYVANSVGFVSGGFVCALWVCNIVTFCS